MPQVKEGSVWYGTERSKQFLVLHVVEQDGHTWVHYRDHPTSGRPLLECKEYSCYIESFLQRFSEVVN